MIFFTFFQKKLTIDDETQFCSEEVLTEVLKSKVRLILFLP